jgi:hypothetical protein
MVQQLSEQLPIHSPSCIEAAHDLHHRLQQLQPLPLTAAELLQVAAAATCSIC